MRSAAFGVRSSSKAGIRLMIPESPFANVQDGKVPRLATWDARDRVSLYVDPIRNLARTAGYKLTAS